MTVSGRALDSDRLIVLGVLVVTTSLAWAWIVPMARDMYGPMSGPSAWMMTSNWDAAHLALLFAMWAVMMTGMMLPSASPTILLYAAVARRSEPARATVRALAFTLGYLVIWTTFAAAAVVVQRWLSNALVITPMMRLSSARAASAVLALAGLYQVTPMKRSCLAACQSPAQFVTEHWRAGSLGALRMGAAHGAFCLGCCWALMLLLFVGGVMHLPTITLLTLLVLLEKLLPVESRPWITGATGSVLLALAAWMAS